MQTYREFTSCIVEDVDFRRKKRKHFGAEYHKIRREIDRLKLTKKQEKVLASLVKLIVLQFEYLAGKPVAR